MKRISLKLGGLIALTAVFTGICSAQSNVDPVPVPKRLLGTWVISRQLITYNVVCFDQAQADALVGLQLIYGAYGLRWRGKVRGNFGTEIGSLKADDFAQENSGGGHNPVNFHQLGIHAPAIQQITLNLEDKGDGVVGDVVMIKSPTRIIVSACGVYYVARKVSTRGSPPTH